MVSRISIIIPALNESAFLRDTLTVIADTPEIETIVVDGGSTDNTREVAVDCGARVVSAPRGRAKQMNVGAAIARGDILLFLHADSKLPPGFADQVRNVLARDQIVAGAFRLAINASGWQMRAMEQLVSWRSVLFQLPYGDQSLFLTAETFNTLGGFPEQPLMEDFEFVRQLRHQGRIEILPQTLETSARRWQQLGIIRTTLINQVIIGAYLLGVAPKRLARWYRRPERKSRSEQKRDLR